MAIPTPPKEKVVDIPAAKKPKKFKVVKGYKGFHYTRNKKTGKITLDCRGHKFEVGKTYELKGFPKLCENGFHFCKDLDDVHQHYALDEPCYMFAEVEALGAIDESNDKCCTTKIKIGRLLSFTEIVQLVATKKKLKCKEFELVEGDNDSEYKLQSVEHYANMYTEAGPYTIKAKNNKERAMYEAAIEERAIFELEKETTLEAWNSPRHDDYIIFIKPGSLKLKLQPREYETLAFNI